MEHVLRLSVCLLAAASAEAQLQFTPVQCSMDSKGNRVCAGWVADANICGAFQFPGGGSHFNKLHCDDVIVQKLKPDGTTIYQRVFGGESDDIPYAFLFDAQDNVVVFGTTYSKQFPTTADAVQRTYAGPTPPTATSFMPLPSGGDVFVSILGPAGDLLYSTFLGSSGNDTLLGVWRAANGQANVLAVAGGSNFPIVPASTAALAGGPVPLAFDMDARKLLRSTYLPITLPDTAAAYTLTLQDDGTIQVATPGGLYTFTHDGVQRSFLSLESFGFAGVPVLASDSFGDLWVEGPNKVGRIVVAKLIAGTTEAFRWVLPSEGSSYVAVPFFGRAGLTYYAGAVEKLLAPRRTHY